MGTNETGTNKTGRMKRANNETGEQWDGLKMRCTRYDRRVDGFPLMSTPGPTLLLTVLYVGSVTVWLPRLMASRPPLCLRVPLALYNAAMVVVSAYCFLEFGLSGWFTDYSLGCQPVDFSSSPSALRMVNVCWLFFISKLVEMLDTVFFVLRKKQSQVTFLHVVHHGLMPLSWWFLVRFVPGGMGTFHALLNSFIHLLMYTYYGIAGLGPEFHKYLWWKKYMTTLQIVQFVLCVLHSAQLMFLEHCKYPKLFAYWILSFSLLFLLLFSNFYQKAYTGGSKKPASDCNGNVPNGKAQNGKRD